MRTVFLDRRKHLKSWLPASVILLFLFYFLVRTIRHNRTEHQLEAELENQDAHGKPPVHFDKVKEETVKEVPFLDRSKLGNFEPPEEPIGDGPGEGGRPYILPDSKKDEAEASLGRHKGICVTASDDISLTRSIPDSRMEECKYWHYPENMGLTVSVILVFHNEGFSTLMRNVHTIFKRSPPGVIEEIILVDDCSNLEDTKEKLDEYIKQFKGKVKLFRNTMREGLIRTRNIGAQNSKGDVLVFLDAHCEVNRNWLPPLLAPIYKNRKTMTVPFIDGINYKTFEYKAIYAPKSLVRGIWEWGFFYKEMDLTEDQVAQRKTQSEPYKSPTHAGGLFAIDRKYFQEMGYYDDGLHIWGGEQYELSFKVWQCGGSIEWVPCSRIGHIYRGYVPAGFDVPETCRSRFDGANVVQKNYKRVIEVWWEEKYKNYFYAREPMVRYMDHGDISKQLAYKEKNQCKSFQWYMENVAPDQLIKFPAPHPNIVWGEMRSVAKDECFDSMGQGPGGKPGLSFCYGGGGSQLFRLNSGGQLGIGERCIDMEGEELKVLVCPEGSVYGPWRYDFDEQTMHNERLESCLAVNLISNALELQECDKGNPYQQWTWKEIRP